MRLRLREAMLKHIEKPVSNGRGETICIYFPSSGSCCISVSCSPCQGLFMNKLYEYMSRFIKVLLKSIITPRIEDTFLECGAVSFPCCLKEGFLYNKSPSLFCCCGHPFLCLDCGFVRPFLCFNSRF